MKASLQRIKQGSDNLHRGTVQMCIDLDVEFDSQQADVVCDKIINSIQEYRTFANNVPMYEESDKYTDGSSLVFYVDSDDVDDFKKAWKEAKKLIK